MGGKGKAQKSVYVLLRGGTDCGGGFYAEEWKGEGPKGAKKYTHYDLPHKMWYRQLLEFKRKDSVGSNTFWPFYRGFTNMFFDLVSPHV